MSIIGQIARLFFGGQELPVVEIVPPDMAWVANNRYPADHERWLTDDQIDIIVDEVLLGRKRLPPNPNRLKYDPKEGF